MSKQQARRQWWTKVTRDAVLFGAGLGLIVREGLTSGPERPSLYILYGGMVGLGPILRYAELRQQSKNGGEE